MREWATGGLLLLDVVGELAESLLCPISDWRNQKAIEGSGRVSHTDSPFRRSCRLCLLYLFSLELILAAERNLYESERIWEAVFLTACTLRIL